MTAAGIALIAGGLATLIGFRHALWGGRGNRRRNRPQRAIEPPRRAVPPAAAAGPHLAEVPRPRGARRRRTGTPAAGGAAAEGVIRGHRERDGGLASLGLADEEPGLGLAGGETRVEAVPGAKPAGRRLPDSGRLDESLRDAGLDHDSSIEPSSVAGLTATEDRAGEPAKRPDGRRPGRIVPSVRPAAPALGGRAEALAARVGTPTGPADGTDEPGMATAVMVSPPMEPGTSAPPRRIDRHGDRVDGWVRPEYQDEQPVSGEYWTPVPERTYTDGGYGWPVPVERLPAVPPQPPSSGFDVEPGNEPTALVPTWPPAAPPDRNEASRSWPVTNDATAGRQAPDQVRKAEAKPNTVDRDKVARWADLDRDRAVPAWPTPPTRPADAHPRSLWPLRADPDPTAGPTSKGAEADRDPMARPTSRGAAAGATSEGTGAGAMSSGTGAGATSRGTGAGATSRGTGAGATSEGAEAGPASKGAEGVEGGSAPVETGRDPFVRTRIRPNAWVPAAPDSATGPGQRPADPVIPDWTPTPPGGSADRDEPVREQPGWNRLGPSRRRVSPVTEFIPVADPTPMVPSLDGPVGETSEAERPRRRPRPRPRPHPPENRSTVYVSKHAAEPG
jgi:hypothetical protein